MKKLNYLLVSNGNTLKILANENEVPIHSFTNYDGTHYRNVANEDYESELETWKDESISYPVSNKDECNKFKSFAFEDVVLKAQAIKTLGSGIPFPYGNVEIRNGLAFFKTTEIEPTKIKEFIICACNKYDDGEKHEHQPINISIGFVVCGRRHHNCISTFAQIVGFPYTELGHKIRKTEGQGFLTNTNRYVDRKEAYKIAFTADQIHGPNKGYAENSIGLTSEDLY